MKHLAFIITLLLVLVGSFQKVSAQSAVPSILFSQETASTSVDSQFVTVLNLDTLENQAGGVGAKLTFDPTYLQVETIETLPVFPDYPAATFDNETGTVVISGIVQNKDQLYTGKAPFANITWKAKAAGNTTIRIQYEPNSTKDSNIAVMFGNGDVLGQVNSVAVTIDGAAPVVDEVTTSSQKISVTQASGNEPTFFDTYKEYFPVIMTVLFILSAIFQAFLFWEVQQFEKKLTPPHP